MNRLLRAILCMLCLVPALMSAQQIKVADFARLRKPFLRPRPYTVDKQFALLDLYTQEKGFEFLIGQQSVQVQEGDGMVTLMLPDMTAFFTIRHPDYGQLVWKVPDGPLHRKKRYHAQLLTDSPDKEFSIAHQWVVFRLQPAQAIVTIDSTMPMVNEDHRDVCNDFIKTEYDVIVAKMDVAFTAGSAKIVATMAGAEAEAVDRVKEKLQEVYDQHKQMCDKLRDEKMQEVEEAYQKYLSEQTEQNKQAEEKQAAEGGQSIFSMNMNDDDE